MLLCKRISLSSMEKVSCFNLQMFFSTRFHHFKPTRATTFPSSCVATKNISPSRSTKKNGHSNPQLPNTPNTLTNPPPLQLTRYVASSGITTAHGAPKTSRMGPCRAKLIPPPSEPPPQRRQGRRRWPWPRTTVEAQRSDESSWGQMSLKHQDDDSVHV